MVVMVAQDLLGDQEIERRKVETLAEEMVIKEKIRLMVGTEETRETMEGLIEEVEEVEMAAIEEMEEERCVFNF